MSGIFGIVHRDGRPVDAADLARMRRAMAHRGPDGSAEWLDTGVGLGQLMLHSTPQSLGETLPWQDPESGLVITADARIDYREELCNALGISGHAAIPDSRLILAAYKRWGVACVHHLEGDFTFAIWDGRARRLFCARDHVGSRPFYYFSSAQRFAFASAAQAVAAAAGVPARLNEARIADYLAFDLEGVDDTCAFFAEVVRLPPAHCAIHADGRFRAWPYWAPNPGVELRLGSDEEYTDAFEEVLGSAVRVRLRSHRPPAAMLSGGVDSSTVAALACRFLAGSGTGLRTYSGISDDESNCRESRNIRRVIGRMGVDARLFRPADVQRMESGLRQVASHIEDPFDGHCTLLAMLYLAARADGSVALLDGLDGDGVASLTSGYPAYLVRAGHFIEAHREIRGLSKNYYYPGGSPHWRDYRDALLPSLVPQALWQKRWERGFRNMSVRALQSSFMAPALAERVDLTARYRAYYRRRGTVMAPSLRHAHVQRVRVPYLTAAIERYARLAAYCGAEHRQPLLDKRVIEFCVSLPWRQKVQGGWSKVGLRRVASRYLPEAVAWRRGWDAISYRFSGAWMALDRDEKRRFISGEAARWPDFIDIDGLHAAVRACHEAGSYGQKEALVFYLLQWLAGRPGQAQCAANAITGSGV